MFSYGFVEIIQSATSFVLLPIFLRYMTQESYGAFISFSLYTSLASTILNLGLSNGVSRYLYDVDRKKISEVIWSPVIFSNSLIIIFAILIYLNHNIFFEITQLQKYENIKLLFVFYTFLLMLNASFRSTLIYLEESKKVFKLGLTTTVISASFCYLLIVKLGFGTYGYIYSLLISNIFFVILSSKFLISRFPIKFDFSALKKQIKFSIPLFLATLSIYILDILDRYQVQRSFDFSTLAQYNILFQFGSIFGIASGTFLTIWPPLFYKNRSLFGDINLYKIVTKLYTKSVLLIVVPSILIAKIVITKYFPLEYQEYINLLPLFFIPYIFQGFYAIFVMSLLVAFKTHVKLIIEVSLMLITILVMGKVVDSYGIVGATYIRPIIYILMSILCSYSCYKYKLIPSKLFILMINSIIIVSIFVIFQVVYPNYSLIIYSLIFIPLITSLKKYSRKLNLPDIDNS